MADSSPDPQQDRGRPGLGILFFVVALGLGFFVGRLALQRRGSSEPTVRTTVTDMNRYRVALRGDEPQLGPDDALVTIVEFADYQCPHCASAREPLERAIEASRGDMRLIFKHYPLPTHRRARPAALAGWAAHQQGRFWPTHQALFEGEGKLEWIEARADALGLDVQRLAADIESDAASQAIDDDLKAGSMLHVTGTPAFFVNGRLYPGKQSLPQWKQIIAAELAEAKAAMAAAGLTQAEVYDHLMSTAKTTALGEVDDG